MKYIKKYEYLWDKKEPKYKVGDYVKIKDTKKMFTRVWASYAIFKIMNVMPSSKFYISHSYLLKYIEGEFSFAEKESEIIPLTPEEKEKIELDNDIQKYNL